MLHTRKPNMQDLFGNELDINFCSYFFCMFDVRINLDLDLNNYIFLLLALLKEMRMQGQSKISSCYICVLRNSEAL